MKLRATALLACCLHVLIFADRSSGADTNKPPADGTHEAEMAIRGFTAPPGVKIELFAAEPMVVNPVAFTIDDRGRFFVAESYRQNKGIEDNRSHGEWLLQDIAARSVADRLAYLKKIHPDKLGDYTKFEDRVVLLQDKNNTGRADSSKVFAGGFNDILDGTGASLLVRGNDVYFTCIPNLWLLRDPKGTGEASERIKLSTGYGIHFALRGHDMHGLRFGPDGKIYWSIGDRGFSVKTKEGKTLDNIDTGAVLRCDPDGSNLEIFATGLRNPQQLAFDKYGNLWTGDNNSDAGDAARWVYVVEGGDTGWRMPYQYRPDRGPYNRENPWHLNEPGHPAWNIPPVAHITNGPSGVSVNPGVTALPEKYRDAFFLCDFRGGAGNSLVHAIWNEPDGAGFKARHEPFIEHVLATDVQFSPDGNLCIADWVNGWEGANKGRIYRAGDPALASSPAVLETKKLLNEGMSKRADAELAKLLEHADMRVRQNAQFELAGRGAAKAFGPVAVATNKPQLARIHAIRGLGQIARKTPHTIDGLTVLLADKDAEVRAQTAKVLGDGHVVASAPQLIPLLKDPNLRVRYFAAMSLGKLGNRAAFEPVVAMLRVNADKDVYLRHAGIFALADLGDTPALLGKATDPSASVRLAALLALRRQRNPEVARFLNDADPLVTLEAARAIQDVPINAAMPALAAALSRKDLKETAFLNRAVNANYRLGKAANSQALASFAADNSRPEHARVDALEALRDWFIAGAGTPLEPQPTDFDRLDNHWRPLAARPATDAATATAAVLPELLKNGSPKLQEAAAQLAGKLKIAPAAAALAALVVNTKAHAEARIEALLALMVIPGAKTADAVRVAMADPDARIRKAGVDALAKGDPAAAMKVLATVLNTGTTMEKQGALSVLGTLKNKEASALLLTLLDRQAAGQLPADIQLDVLEAARAHDDAAIKARLAKLQPPAPGGDLVAQFSNTLTGGDAARGRKIFFENEAVSCVRCHKIGGVGGEAGPDLSHVAARGDRRYLLESIIAPNAKIAAGYERITVSLTDQFYTGRVLAEDATTIKLEITNDDGTLKPVTVLKSQVTERKGEPSAMLEGFKDILKPAELRDLVEFLATQK